MLSFSTPIFQFHGLKRGDLGAVVDIRSSDAI